MRHLSPRLWMLAIAHFTIDAYSSFFSPLLPLLVHKLDLNLGLVGGLVAIASLASSFSQPLFGWLSDRVRRPWFLALGPPVAALFMSGIGLAPTYWALVGLLVLAGFGVAAFHPQAAVLAGESSPRRGLAMSVFVTGGTLGFSIGPLIAVTLVSRFGLERTWIAIGPGLVMGVLLTVWALKLPPHAIARRERPDVRELRPHLRPLTLLYFATVCRSAVSYGFMTFLPLYLTGRGASLEHAGRLVSLYLVLGASGGLLGGWLSDRWGGRRVVTSSFLLAAPLYMAFLAVPLPYGLVPLVVGSFVLQASLPVNVVLGQQLSPRHSSAISSLLMGAAWGVGALLIGPIGVLADHYGLRAGLLALSVLLVVGWLLANALPRLAPPATVRASSGPATAS
ncbi:MAG: MFS transporter [Candidatus Eisenbacteria bacterium]|uniref:MFS transporter n=1 Tax=Eiseniibacteriota bacterium TaxID=2212470 RepID=A0A849SFV9_UNCEI|nr:MFS transporter [Candidatus Eisenbacteria bacterium]